MNKGQDEEIPVEIKNMLPTRTGSGVFLGNAEKTIAIFVDPMVAMGIAMQMRRVKAPRPMTHDLIGNILAGLGAKVEKVVVNDLKDDTFYARIYITQENELGRCIIEVDARPSDSIALALQQGCPVYVSRKVWDKAEDMTWAMEQMAQDESGEDTEDSPEK
ncbi:MAG: bifunctional nuclease family protein [Verrucomicrobia bacterium]|nr:MAG: bifunctional nuclease family protein [Verrucomicrobiota bacterium]